MNTISTHPSLHPMQWVMSIAVTLLAITGIAAMTGMIPKSKSAEAPSVAAVPAPIAPVITTAPSVSAPAATVAAATPAPKVIVKYVTPVEHHHAAHVVQADSAPQYAPIAPPKPVAAICTDCGRIESIQRIVHEGEGSGVGAVAGGVLGGTLGNGIGQKNGRAIATVVGLVGGAMLGNHIEKSQKQSVSYQTTVRFEDGTTRVFNSPYEQGFREGQNVRVVNGYLQPV